MKTKVITAIMLMLFLVSMLGMAFGPPAKAEYLADPYTVGLWHLDNEFGYALEFDGIDDYVEVPYSGSLDITGEGTIEAWVYAKGTGTMLKIACKRETQVPFYFIGVDGGKLYAGIGDETSYVVTDKVTDLPLNEWHYVAMAYSDANDKIWLYLDGELKETKTCAISLVQFESNLLIGAQLYNGKYVQFFKGIIDEVRINKVARTSFDLSKPLTVDDHTIALWHFNEGSGDMAYDETENNNDGTIHGATWVDSTLAIDSSPNKNFGTIHGATWVDGKFGKALCFDGVDDYVIVRDSPSLDITGQITIETWVNIGSSTTMKMQTMIRKEGAYLLEPQHPGEPTPNAYVFGVWTGGVFKGVWGTTPLSTGEWYHVMGTYDGAYLKLYLNGVLEASVAHTGPIDASDHPLYIGKEFRYYETYNGIVDEVRISDVARVPVDVDIDPDTLNLKSNGQWITAYITLPEGYDVGDIGPAEIYLDGIQAAWSEIQDCVYMAKFDRTMVQTTLTGMPDYGEGIKFQELKLTVTCKLSNGQVFEGSDTIKVITK